MVFETRPCAFCGKFAGFADDSLGPLLGPVVDDRSGVEYYAHRLCALWSPEVYQTDTGTLCQVLAAIKRTRAIRCCICNERGASIGCRVDKCVRSYHLACAGKGKCLFDTDAYVLACPVHARLFKNKSSKRSDRGPLESPDEAFMPETAAANRGQEFIGRENVISAQLAARDVRKRARQLAEGSSDDEDHFRRKEQRRLARDRANLRPIVLGGGQQHASSREHPATKSAAFPDGWEAVGGLSDVVTQLKEMVLLPLIYPGIFADMGLTPPRGILFHGEPGTGKTLIARALAGACAQHSPVSVSFFSRKGADCLGKFLGEAERTLRLLFDEAARCAPAIIFLDELDGLVPARSTREGSGDQIYASVVATLLALMDGVSDRGAVIVIGATNRPEAVDPALRRPGRFDREVYFRLPGVEDRRAILGVHTSRWRDKPSVQLLSEVAVAADGFAGADLQALCSAAVMAAVRRNAPDLLDGLNSHESKDSPLQRDELARQHLLDNIKVQRCDWQLALRQAAEPCSRRQGAAALAAVQAKALQNHHFPLLAPALHCALKLLSASGIALPKPAKEATEAARCYGAASPEFESGMCKLHAVLAAEEGLEPPGIPDARSTLQVEPVMPHGQAQSRLLIAGIGEVGQECVSGALLHLFDGCPMHTLSLPALITSGHGEVPAGLLATVKEALRRAVPDRPCIFFLPRLEAWAVHSWIADESDVGETAEATPGHAAHGLSFPVTAANKRSSPCKLSTPKASPFRGLTSLEERSRASPHQLKSAAHKAKPATPKSLQNPLSRDRRMSVDAQGASVAESGRLADASPANPLMLGHKTDAGDMQVTALSDGWQVFVQLMKEVPASQPALVLGTFHGDLEDLPTDLLSFFDASSGSSGNSLQPAVAHIVPATAETKAEALSRAADLAADQLCREGAEVLERYPRRLLSNATPPASLQHGDVNDARAALRSKTTGDGAADLHDGCQLFAKVARSIHDLAMRLAEDPRSRLIRFDDSDSNLEPDTQSPSLLSILAQAKAGQLPTRATFFGSVIEALSAAAHAAEGMLGYSARAAAANAIYDEICAWDQRLTASLGLSDPRKLAMLHRAEAQVELQICNARLHRASQPPDKGTGAAVEPGPNSPATAALPAGAHQGPVNRTGALAKDPQNAEALGRLRLAAKASCQALLVSQAGLGRIEGQLTTEMLNDMVADLCERLTNGIITAVAGHQDLLDTQSSGVQQLESAGLVGLIDAMADVSQCVRTEG